MGSQILTKYSIHLFFLNNLHFKNYIEMSCFLSQRLIAVFLLASYL